MRYLYRVTPVFRALFLSLVLLSLSAGTAVAKNTKANVGDNVWASYHGQMGKGFGDGMLEKWCALPNFSFYEQGKIAGWTSQSCNACHIGSDWNLKAGETGVDCTYCHASATPSTGDIPTIGACRKCHDKDTAKRGDLFTPEEDVHIALGMVCQTCHERVADKTSDHQFLKGTAMDTTEPTMEGTLSCTTKCHQDKPHENGRSRGNTLNSHTEKIACETCHTGLRPGKALASRQWNVFTAEGKPLTKKWAEGWLPVHKWYDKTGPGASGDFHLPILGYTERRDFEGAKIYPFNAVTVDWFVKSKDSTFDDVIIVPEVKAADDNNDGTVTVEEMRAVEGYGEAELVTADMNFSINHSVVPANLAFDCKDCHGRNGWVLDWEQLGYEQDPRGLKAGKDSKGNSKGGGKNK